MASSGPTTLFFLLHWIVYFYIADVSCSLLELNLASDTVGEAQYGISADDVRGKIIKRRQVPGDWCVIPPPMQNGKYRPSTLRCPPENTTPACQMLEGAFVYPDWVIYVDSCDPGYVVTTKHRVAVCSKGRWLPRLPTCGACPRSDTLVNGKTVCRGEVIFEDTFSGGQLSKKWRHRISFGQEGRSWQFNEFTSDNKNIFTSNGHLVIKPTVHHDAYVTSESVELEGCTASRGSTECVRKASPDKILPPIRTAIISTYNVHGFTYGEVEIRAKFPKGDWLAPGLWLESTEDYYGSGDASGRIEIGVSLGNSDLRCDGEDFGLGRVDYRLTMGPKNKLKYKPFHKQLLNKWHDDYHIYTVIWRPGSIEFKIDNELVGGIDPEDKTLCETFNKLTKEYCEIYSKGSKMAPLDKNFFISLGLTAGDLRSETDNCINRGKVKPWKSLEPQALVKFWQDRDNWLPTWTEDGSSLYIDYVRVTAV